MIGERFDRARCIATIERYWSSTNTPSSSGLLDNLDDGEVAALSDACRGYLKFGSLVDAAVSGRLDPSRNILIRDSTPRALLELGVPDLPWVTTQRHIEQELSPKGIPGDHGHGLTRYGLKRLPERIERPFAVYESRRHGIVCVLDDHDSDGLPLVMPFDPSVEDHSLHSRGMVNFVLSLYGVPGLAKRLTAALAEDRLLYLESRDPSGLLGGDEHRRLLRSIRGARGCRQGGNAPLRELSYQAIQGVPLDRNGLSPECR